MTTVDLVIPVYNEEHVLRRSVETLRSFLRGHADFLYDWSIVIANNASRDQTLDVAEALAAEYPNVRVVDLPQKGRGRALRAAWLSSHSDVAAYMDVDLSTHIDHVPELIHAIAREGYDVATGSRLARGSKTTRGPKREFISRVYNLIVKATFFTSFSDAQCGFKALSRRAVEDLVPLIEDQAWFFDSELLILAEKRGYQIKDIPVLWLEDPDTRVKIASTAFEDLRGLARLRSRPLPQPIASSEAAAQQPAPGREKPVKAQREKPIQAHREEPVQPAKAAKPRVVDTVKPPKAKLPK